MNAIKSLAVAALVAAGTIATANAQAASHGSGGFHGGGHFSGGHFSGGHFRGGPRFGFFIGAPLLFSPWYWGYPYGYPYDYYYPRTVVVDRVVEPYPASYPEGVMQAPATTEVPRTQGAPTQGPAYLNYCESAKAYFPKVGSCPEGWKFIPAR